MTADSATSFPASPTILLVEDDADLRDSIAWILEEEGFRVARAENGRVALDYLRGHEPPRLVLLDLMMPVMNGWEFRDTQMRDPELSAIPVAVLSADSRTRLKAKALGVDSYLMKPVVLEQLLGLVASFRT